MDLLIFDSPEEVARQASSRVGDLISEGDGPFSLGLAGGSTPMATYRLLRDRATGWQRVSAWLSDERWVAHDHERSNGRMAFETLLEHVDASFHRPPWSLSITAAESAAEYESRLRSVFGPRGPDLIMLGMGDDGHTASLFPGTPALGETTRWYVANRVGALGEERLTATYPLLWSARLLLLMAVGRAKAQALEAAFEGATPAGRLGEGEARVEWYVDKEAASLVS
jgi:6-phosphogluconolactonase